MGEGISLANVDHPGGQAVADDADVSLSSLETIEVEVPDWQTGPPPAPGLYFIRVPFGDRSVSAIPSFFDAYFGIAKWTEGRWLACGLDEHDVNPVWEAPATTEWRAIPAGCTNFRRKDQVA